MTESTVPQVGRAAGSRSARVLVFNVDDALFGLHIDWIEATVPLSSVELHHVKDAEGRSQAFLLHRGEPALVVDLRDAFDLTSLLGPAERRELLIARSPSFLLAIPVDGCVGIRELDLEAHPPIPASLVRDGGFPVAQLVALDGKPLSLIDPSHLLDAHERDALVPLVQKARAFRERQVKSDGLWREICARPSESNLRVYARLCSRNGRAKAAAATRVVLRHLEGLSGSGGRRLEPAESSEDIAAWEPALAGAGGDLALSEAEVPAQERFLRELICLAGEMATGELIVPQGDGAEESRVYLVGGRVVQAHHLAERGRSAFQKMLGSFPEHFYFVETGERALEQRIGESTAALLIGSLEALGRERRPRRPRPATALVQ